ncbi:VanZ family protein [Labedella endophytica]|uniref:VanZ family protein n=1 Tax=Labedella endophytica TaxID=1523160 RepID=A0A433JWV6_9MICO|nr:VanZ family protein [Labedella endophytica]RUR03485.1 VanZ family protein [Labedella endophytica]
MSEWGRQAIIGVFGGGGVFVAVFVPILILQYRRYGRVSVGRLVGAAALSIYAVALLAYTFLPLPDSRAACLSGGIPAQLSPFAVVDDIATDVRDHGTSALLTGRATLQFAFNVLLFVPLGVIARRYFTFGIASATLLGLATSFVIEATQYTGIWGLYSCAYRVSDVDDLIANTSGALVGALIAPAVLWWMPRSSELRSGRLEARPVTVWRRWAGMIVDLLAFSAVSTTIAMAISSIRLLSGDDAAATPLESVVAAVAAGLLVFLLPALVGSGASIGQRIVWLEPVRAGVAHVPLGRRLVRALSSGGAYTVSVAVGSGAVADVAWSLVLLAVQLAATGLVIAAVVSVPVTRGRRGLSGVLAGTELIDARGPHPSVPDSPSRVEVP